MRENEIVESTRQRANIQPHSPRDDGPVPRHDLEGHAADAVGGVAHAGWVKRTVGTGGRAGRVFYETLVAGGTIGGDASDDIKYPDA